MKKKTAGVILIGMLLALSLMAVPADAQQRDRSTAKPIGPQGYSKGKPETQQQPDAATTQRNAWLQGDERQQDQLVGCFQLSATLAQHSRDIRKMIVGSETKWKEVAGQFEDLRRGVELLSEKHEGFANGLNNGQRSWWEKTLQEIMALELQLHEQMGAIGRGLSAEKPESFQMVKSFTDLEGRFRKWNQLYGQIGADMNMPDLAQQLNQTRVRGLPGAQGPGR